ncbi:hypothetical protein C9374_007825 [Naegleria lovaniensis]|uniref:Uncharacterized protein n=1 Tax=Naegleria lovaniensis TaxID=51637 RepID=A0AA88GJT5_NAELO|nr:uncharacterized protein C9374_007825 [Naegleria lovaniensis]KAG2378677.1 hypothetical protein C9374_007825 [Naegleria lovaniensis]
MNTALTTHAASFMGVVGIPTSNEKAGQQYHAVAVTSLSSDNVIGSFRSDDDSMPMMKTAIRRNEMKKETFSKKKEEKPAIVVADTTNNTVTHKITNKKIFFNNYRDGTTPMKIVQWMFLVVMTILVLLSACSVLMRLENHHDEPTSSSSSLSDIHSDTFIFVNGARLFVSHRTSLFNIKDMMNEGTGGSSTEIPEMCVDYVKNHSNSTHTTEEGEHLELWQYIVYSILSMIFICGAGLMSGFNLGLLSIDTMQLDILKKTGTEREKKYAARLAPILKNHHLLLVTLLLWNAVCVECLPLFLDKIVPEYVAIILGITAVLFFGEIIPQAVITRYGIAIGGTFYWFVWILIAGAFVVAWPVGKLLDWILGADHGTFFKRTELKELVNIHLKTHDPKYHLTEHEAKILGGALDFARTSVSQIMTRVENAYMLDVDGKLDVDSMTSIWQAGHSRIPVYKGNKNNIIGMLYVKDLVLINPEESLPLSTVLTFYGREVLKVFPDTYCDEMLKIFKSGKTHMAIVHEPREPESGGDPYYAIVGIVTLEDIIEEIIKDEIVDETDIYVDNTSLSKINRPQNSILLKLERIHRLTPKQVLAVSSYLIKSSPIFRTLPEDCLHKLLGKCAVIDFKKTPDREIFITEKGKECDYFTLVLSGKIEILFGEDKFVSEMGPWSLLGERALTKEKFIPDFDARIAKDTSIVKISKKDFIEIIAQAITQDSTLPHELEWMSPYLTNLKQLPPASPHNFRITKPPVTMGSTTAATSTMTITNESGNTIPVSNTVSQTGHSVVQKSLTSTSSSNHEVDQLLLSSASSRDDLASTPSAVVVDIDEHDKGFFSKDSYKALQQDEDDMV